MKHRISWTNETWNVCTGCTPTASGCQNCYARRMHERLRRMGQSKYQHDFSEVRCHPEELNKPSHWKKPRMVFVNSMSDLFHGDVPDEFIDDVFSIMSSAKQHTFQVLTKRPKRMLRWHETLVVRPDIYPIPNLWLGFSASTQDELDEGLPYLLKTPAAVRGVSLEPLLEYIECPHFIGEKLFQWGQPPQDPEENGTIESEMRPCKTVDWVIVGAESKGSHPGRECKLDWVYDIAYDCAEGGVPLFIKQLHIDGKLVKDVERFPEDLRIQEFPEVK
jgi:protein gp37